MYPDTFSQDVIDLAGIGFTTADEIAAQLSSTYGVSVSPTDVQAVMSQSYVTPGYDSGASYDFGATTAPVAGAATGAASSNSSGAFSSMVNALKNVFSPAPVTVTSGAPAFSMSNVIVPLGLVALVFIIANAKKRQ